MLHRKAIDISPRLSVVCARLSATGEPSHLNAYNVGVASILKAELHFFLAIGCKYVVKFK